MHAFKKKYTKSRENINFICKVSMTILKSLTIRDCIDILSEYTLGILYRTKIAAVMHEELIQGMSVFVITNARTQGHYI